MPVYNYTALKAGKDVTVGKIEALSLKEAREALRKMNLVPTKIEELGSSNSAKAGKSDKSATKTPTLQPKRSTKLKRLGMRDKIDFTNTLFVLSKAGISVVEALFFIEINSNSKNVRNLASELRKQVLAGSNLSEAITKYPKIFDQIFAGLIRTGEESGELDSTLNRMVFLLDKQDKLRSKVVGTLIYPCFIVVLAILVSLVMIMFVFPAFKGVYDSMGKQLPFITQLFIDTGIFLRTYWFVLPISIATFAYSIYTVFKWPSSRRVIDGLSLKIPVFRTFVNLAALSNFFTVLKVAFDAGVPIIDGLLLANLTIKNYILRDKLRETVYKIQHGQSLSVALKSSGAIPGIVMCMISTGEQSGQLGDLLEQASMYIDTQLERVIDTLNKLFEPLLLVVIGGIVLVLALALYLPLFNSYSNIV